MRSVGSGGIAANTNSVRRPIGEARGSLETRSRLRHPRRLLRLTRPASGVAVAALFGAGAAVVSARFADPGLVGIDRNASNWPGTQAEVSIAVDPSDPAVVLAASMSLSDGRILAMSSRDAGATWTRVPVPRGEGSTIDNDPMVAFDTGGTAYLARVPAGASGTRIDLLRSPDGGRTWDPAVRISDSGMDDKVALAVDDTPESSYRDRVYVAWKLPRGGVFVARSLDRGATFTAPLRIDDDAVSGLDLAIGADGIVYLAFADYPRRSIRVMRSLDGGETFEASVAVAPMRTRAYVAPPSQCVRPAIVHASISVDRSDGAHRGAVYAAWADYPPGVGRTDCPEACGAPAVCVPGVYFARSDDGGLTWPPPALVDEERAGEVDRYHQWIRVDRATGDVFVVYKDSRNDSTRAGADVYLRRSTDGGASWESAVRLSSATSRAATNFQFGDYQSVAVEGGQVYAAWADYRQSPAEGEIYVRRYVAPRTTDRLPIERVPSRPVPPREISPRP
jgi:hypothetical protein